MVITLFLILKTGTQNWTPYLLIEEGFKEGAEWAINEFLKDLWHQTNKEPEGYDEWILLHYSVGNYYSLAQVKEFKSWKGFVENMPIDGWFYIDDLFSKEGGGCK
jgi:hypothetical protein